METGWEERRKFFNDRGVESRWKEERRKFLKDRGSGVRVGRKNENEGGMV